MSERIRARENLHRNASGECSNETHQAIELSSKRAVREPDEARSPASIPPPFPSPLAHPLNRLTVQLNTKWRVTDDPLQWVLQRKRGNPRKKNSGWQDRSFCRTREGLLRCVREYCGDVDGGALAELRALPDFHPDWEISR